MVDQTPDSEIERLRAEIDRLRKEKLQAGDAWQRTLLARHDQRPYALDYVERLFQDFSEIHGDRRFSDDPAIVAGMATYHGHPVMVIGQQKGRDLRQRQFRNFGYAQPEGYRKALRAMKLAEKFSRAIVSFVDTPGAYPSVGAEERGQAEAIAHNLREIATIRVPIVVVIIGEGGSGGALAIGVGDTVLMLENSFYSVISPEGCAAILWKDQSAVSLAAENMRIRAKDLLEFGIIDKIIPEPPGGAHIDPEWTFKSVDKHLSQALKKLETKPVEEMLEERYQKFRKMGVYTEK